MRLCSIVVVLLLGPGALQAAVDDRVNITAHPCAARCVAEDDTRLVHVNLAPALAKDFGVFTAPTFDILKIACRKTVEAWVDRSELPYALTQLVSSQTLFTSRLYQELIPGERAPLISTKSIRATKLNSCAR